MRLSRLQKYILAQCLETASGYARPSSFINFYSAGQRQNKRKNIVDAIHKSLNHLVAHDLLIAEGRQTAKKWHVNRVKLTARGRRRARQLIKDRQDRLPFK